MAKKWARPKNGVKVSLELKFVGNVFSDFTNILHLTTGPNGNYIDGSRNPAIFVYPNSRSLQIAANINGNWNYDFKTEEQPVNKWIKLTISQILQNDQTYMYAIALCGNIIHNITNEIPRAFPNVKGVRVRNRVRILSPLV